MGESFLFATHLTCLFLFLLVGSARQHAHTENISRYSIGSLSSLLQYVKVLCSIDQIVNFCRRPKKLNSALLKARSAETLSPSEKLGHLEDYRSRKNDVRCYIFVKYRKFSLQFHQTIESEQPKSPLDLVYSSAFCAHQ